MTDTEIIGRAADGARDGRGRAWLWAFVGIGLAGLIALAIAFFASRSETAGRDAEQDRTIVALRDQADANASDAQTLADQVRQLGAEPVVDPPTPGDRGADGASGRDGVDGRDGRDGVDGTDGTNPPCLTEPPQCRGVNGQDGAGGADGTNGADGTAGQDGADGRDGQDGQDGAPPAGWTWVDGDGREQSCARDGGTDDAPLYTCTTEPPPETVPGFPLPIGG